MDDAMVYKEGRLPIKCSKKSEGPRRYERGDAFVYFFPVAQESERRRRAGQKRKQGGK